MKILVIGAGLSGCTFARLLKDRGHDVSIYEQLDIIGGLCFSKTSPNGILYEPYGARTFHTTFDDVRRFVTRFAKFNTYIHRKGTIIQNKLFPYPVNMKTVHKLPQRDKILKELSERPNEPDRTNFETFMISFMGKTLYHLFFYNYTKKMWGLEPCELSAEWAPKRIELRQEDTNHLFPDQWQGLPIKGYSKFLRSMINDIHVILNMRWMPQQHPDLLEMFDLILYSGRIDEILNFNYGKLPYRSLHFDYVRDEQWENDRYGTINLPEHLCYIRKANFKILHQIQTPRSWIQYQKPVNPDTDHLPMYPVKTNASRKLFQEYLQAVICAYPNVIPVGRLGLFKYLDMDKAVKLALDMVSLVERWSSVSAKTKFKSISVLREKCL